MSLTAQDKYLEKIAFLWRNDTLRFYGIFFVKLADLLIL